VKVNILERRIGQVYKQALSSGIEAEKSSDYISGFINGTKEDDAGLQGGKYFTVTYFFIGSVGTLSSTLFEQPYLGLKLVNIQHWFYSGD